MNRFEKFLGSGAEGNVSRINKYTVHKVYDGYYADRTYLKTLQNLGKIAEIMQTDPAFKSVRNVIGLPKVRKIILDEWGVHTEALFQYIPGKMLANYGQKIKEKWYDVENELFRAIKNSDNPVLDRSRNYLFNDLHHMNIIYHERQKKFYIIDGF